MLYAQVTAPNVNFRPMHTHPHHEIMFVLEGEGSLITQYGEIPFSPGCLFIAPPNVPHATRSKISHRIISIGEHLDNLTFLTDIYETHDTEFGEAKMLAETALRYALENEAYANACINALVRFALMKRTEYAKDVYSTIYRIISIMEDRYGDPHLRAGDLMRASGYAEDYIRSKFLEVAKMPPVKFLNHVRIKNAGDMLLSTELSVNEIAQKCGFLDMAYFSKTFKSHFGMSPRKYKMSSESQI
ncbi:MAG: helix-turn-helix domain-containing protein [Clostridia bacterium]|nr:helix-turn-helix domain-containing protein [Clostridia bacterium]MBO5315582.1 helix-turn-helix domain-containing protein [Clostridia bacterium]MBR3806095.1 helix-turn-helix domain-containing protein [Clostridia bacterium]